MRSKAYNIGIIVFFVMCAAIGFFLVYVNHRQPAFTQCSLFNVLQLLATLGVAVLVAHYLRNRYTDKQLHDSRFVEVAADMSRTLESELGRIVEFMEDTSRPQSGRA